MSKKKLFLAAIFFSVISACSKPEGLQFVGYKNFQVQTMGLTNGMVGIDLAFYNPNRFPLQLKKADLNVFLNQNLLGHFSQDTLFNIPPRDTFYYPLRMKVNLINLLANIQNTNFHDSVNILAEGSCKVGRKGFFISVPVHYATRRSFNFSGQ